LAHVADACLGEAVARYSRHRDRNVLKSLFASLRGDDNILDALRDRRGRLLRSIWSRCCRFRSVGERGVGALRGSRCGHEKRAGHRRM